MIGVKATHEAVIANTEAVTLNPSQGIIAKARKRRSGIGCDNITGKRSVIQNITAVTANQAVIASATIQRVVAIAAINGFIARAAQEMVIARTEAEILNPA
jgi:chemotaxis protein histidine kinase CheA